MEKDTVTHTVVPISIVVLIAWKSMTRVWMSENGHDVLTILH